MGVMDLLNRATGKKDEMTRFEEGIRFNIEHYKMYMQNGYLKFKINENKVISVPVNKVVIYSNNIQEYYKLNSEDIIASDSEGQLMSVDANRIHYVRNETWVPDPEAKLPSRIMETTPLGNQAIISEQFWVTRRESECYFIDRSGRYFSALYTKVQTGGRWILEDGWCDVIVTREWDSDIVAVAFTDAPVPTLAQVIAGHR